MPEPPLVPLPKSSPSYPTLSQEGRSPTKQERAQSRFIFPLINFVQNILQSGVLGFHQKARAYYSCAQWF